MSISQTFDRVVLINLARRSDRLATFRAELERVKWPFKEPQIFEAIDGGSGRVPCPAFFKQGGGAWGCRQSHISVLERAIQDGVRHLLFRG
jgi:GR25 family glycosyltransferase involved in LPS biosynthesis